MSDQNPRPIDDQRLEAFLDGQLTGEQSDAVREQAAADPGLHEQIETQKRIDEGLGRLAKADAASADHVLAMLTPDHAEQPPAAQHKPARPLWIKAAAVAAVLALVGVGVWMQFFSNEQDQEYARPQTVVMTAVYRAAEANQFEPDWLCESDAEFRETFKEKLGEALSMKPLPGDRKMLGLSYLARGTGEGVYMLAQAKDQPVIVFFDLADQMRFYNMIPPDGMKLHQGAIGKVQVIEMSALDEPVFIPYLTQEPQAWPSE
ncbi:MAG: hypothetical protein KTR15_03470 [Phycisphaeraceae bacterium]|nr:hypothetical protein [Phycisphaeraceae bacterium]